MNANELADAMEIRASIRRKATSRKSVTEGANDRLADQLDQAATMLRQQQTEIEAFKQIIDANNLNQNIGQFVKPTNEPVAWIGETLMGRQYINGQKDELLVGTALYTHPVKELSETRIKQIFVEQTGFYFDDNPADDLALMDFAKALLLEAQEK